MNGYIIASALFISVWTTFVIIGGWPLMKDTHAKIGLAAFVIVPIITFALGLLC